MDFEVLFICYFDEGIGLVKKKVIFNRGHYKDIVFCNNVLIT